MVMGNIIAIIGLLLTLIIFIFTRIKSNRIAKDILMHDMVKTEQEYWQRLTKRGKKTEAQKTQIFNYYEYLAYLILRGKIDEKEAYDLWKPNILNMYKKFGKKYFSKERTELKKLYEKWQKIKAVEKSSLTFEFKKIIEKIKKNKIKIRITMGLFLIIFFLMWRLFFPTSLETAFIVSIAILYVLLLSRKSLSGESNYGAWAMILLTVIFIWATLPVLRPGLEIDMGHIVEQNSNFTNRNVTLIITPPVFDLNLPFKPDYFCRTVEGINLISKEENPFLNITAENNTLKICSIDSRSKHFNKITLPIIITY